MKNRVVLLLVVFATPLMSQRPLSLSASAGIAVGNGQGGEYLERSLGGPQFAASARYAPGRVGIFLEASHDDFGHLPGGDAICVSGSDGQCMPPYPEVNGTSTELGLLFAPANYAELRAGVGPAWYQMKGRTNERVVAMDGIVDVALFPLQHLGIGLGIRGIDLHRYRGARLSFYPISLGIRAR